MTQLNQLIAASGQKLYENVRKGYLERPEEARARGLEELKLSGMGQEQELRGLQIESERARAEEHAAEAPTRELELAERARQVYPERTAQKIEGEKLALEQVQLSMDNTQKAMDRAITNQERKIIAEDKVIYNNLTLGAINQKDTAASVEHIRKNKQAFLDAGTDEEDAGIEELLSAAPEQQAAILESMEAANDIIIAENMKLQQAIAKAAAKATTTDKRSEEHTSELQSPDHLVSRLLLETKKFSHTNE